MGRAYPFDIDTGETRQRALHELAVLADDIGIVTVHLREITVRLHLAVGHRAVERNDVHWQLRVHGKKARVVRQTPRCQ